MTEAVQVRPEIGREIATTADGRDITRGFTGPLLLPYDPVLQRRGMGDLVIYEQVFSDPEVKSCFGQRQGAVTAAEWKVDAGGTAAIDKAAAEFSTEQLNKIGWDRVTNLMLFGVFFGYAVAETVYAIDANRVVLKKVAVRNRRRFRFGKDMDLRLLTPQRMFDGEPAEEPYFWHYSCGADNDDEPYGQGLAHWLYWPTLFKRQGIKFWLIFLDKFAGPTAVGKYPPGSTQADVQRLLQALQAIQQDSAIAIPQGMEADLLEAARSGTTDYKTLCEYMDGMIQKVILGQTASTQGSPGKLGNDKLQAQVRGDIIKADADLICESWNRGPGKWLTEFNFRGAKVPRVYRVTEEPEDLTERAERDTKVKALGFKPKLKYVQDTYGGEWEEASEPDPLDQPGAGLAQNRAGTAQFAEGAEDPDAPARMVQQLDRRVAPAGKKWVAQIRQAAERAQSWDELLEYIDRIGKDLSLDEYAAALGEALTAARLAGRYEITQEIVPV